MSEQCSIYLTCEWNTLGTRSCSIFTHGVRSLKMRPKISERLMKCLLVFRREFYVMVARKLPVVKRCRSLKNYWLVWCFLHGADNWWTDARLARTQRTPCKCWPAADLLSPELVMLATYELRIHWVFLVDYALYVLNCINL